MSRAMIQMICDITGVIPKEADILTDQEVVLGIEDQSSIIEVSRANKGYFIGEVKQLQWIVLQQPRT